MKKFFNFEQVPADLKQKMLKYANEYLIKNDNEEIMNILEKMHPVLGQDISMRLFGPDLLQFDIFEGSTTGFMRSLSTMVK